MPQSEPDDPWSHPLVVAELPAKKPVAFTLTPPADIRDRIAQELGLRSLRKLRFSGTITPVGTSDWQLCAQLGATAVQSCVVTLEPVTSRIDEQVKRSFLRSLPEFEAGSELEMPLDDTTEILPDIIDPGAILVEALVLALPQFPRAPGAALEQTQFTTPGKPAMTDADARPFAHLKALRDGPENDTE